MHTLTKSQVLQQLSGLDWTIVDGKLYKRWSFSGFDPAKAFVDRVCGLAQAHNHHPDLAFGWGYATLTLWTHDALGLTGRDIALVLAIEGAQPA